MNISDAVNLARIIKDALGRRRLSGVDVGGDADISCFIQGVCSGHS
jgi:hypothetical protein